MTRPASRRAFSLQRTFGLPAAPDAADMPVAMSPHPGPHPAAVATVVRRSVIRATAIVVRRGAEAETKCKSGTKSTAPAAAVPMMAATAVPMMLRHRDLRDGRTQACCQHDARKKFCNSRHIDLQVIHTLESTTP